MRTRIFLNVLLACAVVSAVPEGIAAASAAPGDDRGLGLGVIIGEPTGLTAKVWRSAKGAFDVGLAYSFDEYLMTYADYLGNFPGAFAGSSKFSKELVPYIGVGAVLALGEKSQGTFRGDDVGLGVRVPFGIEWLPRDYRFGVFLELVPGMSIIPDTDGLLQGGLGIRYYF